MREKKKSRCDEQSGSLFWHQDQPLQRMRRGWQEMKRQAGFSIIIQRLASLLQLQAGAHSGHDKQ